jgi:predicted NBD/HSP70 family sugar kinase
MVLVPAKMGRFNKRALLGRLQRLGQASRADLAKSLGLSQPTTGKIADELIAFGVLEEMDEGALPVRSAANRPGRAPAKLGRPGRMLRLNRSEARFLAIQLGVTETSLAALPVGADPEDRWELSVETPDSAEAWVKQLKGAAGRFRDCRFWGALVSVPGIVDEQRARVLFSPNLHWTEKADLPKLVQQVWPVPAELVQEERALALGHQNVDPENEDFLLVDFGEGVGGAVLVAGRLYANPLPISGELGHTPVLGNQRPCGCGAVGCVETLVSTRGLLQSCATAHRKAPKSWAALRSTIAKQGLEPWLAEALDAAAVVIAGALNVLGLRHVIITGSLTDLPPAVTQHLSRAIVQGAMWARFGNVEVETAPRRRTAGLVAVGIDRLVLPMTAQNPRAPAAASAAPPSSTL